MSRGPAGQLPHLAGVSGADGSLQLRRSDRVLILAPHPDDETLAAGALIQMALLAGASVRIIVATDGDNNPWPQRWLERRWRLGPHACRRWGTRRRRESRQALRTLGVDPSSVVFLGWPDQKLTQLLLAGGSATRGLLQAVDDFMPSHVVVPVLDDRHPDHSALRVLFETAVAGTVHASCQRLGFALHADMAATHRVELVPNEALLARKLAALEAYRSQLSLSRRRMLGWARRAECFSRAQAQDSSALTAPRRLRLAPWCLRGDRYRVLVLLTGADGTLRMTLDVPAYGRGRTEMVAGVPGASVQLRRRGLSVWLCIHDPQQRLGHGYAKLDRCGARLFIFDHDGWHDLCAPPARGYPAPAMPGRAKLLGPA